MNPIKYSELIYNDTGGFKDLADELAKISKNYNAIARSVEAHKEKIREGLQAANPATPEGQSLLNQYAASILELEKRVKTLETALKSYKQVQKEVSDLDAAAIRRKIEHKEQVKEMTNMVKEYVAEQKLSEKALDELSKKEDVQKMSYNQLSQAYTQLKNKINEMTAATNEEIQAREKLSAIARGVYEQMNTLQQATGKYTLQVGNYAKSWNGLNIAFQQIVREVPNMAMGFNTFFLAISNNIPILSDQIKLAKDKYKADLANIAALEAAGAAEAELTAARAAAIPVGKQILSSLFSWQTAMMAGVALLTMFGGKMIEHISNWIKARRAIDDTESAMRAYNDSLRDSSRAGAEAVSKVETLYKVATDLNGSMEDRLGAVKDLKALYPDVFDGLETEAILAGNAKDQYDKLAESIYKSAMAEAAYSKIADVASKEIDARLRKRELDQRAIEQGFLGASDMLLYDDQYMTKSNGYGGYYTVNTLSKEQQDIVKNYKAVEKELEAIANEREAIQKMMEDNDLFGFLQGGNSGGRRGSKGETIADYYWAAINAFIEGTYEGSSQGLLKMRAAYSQLKEEMKAEEAELIRIANGDNKELAKAAEEQLGNLRTRMVTEQIKYEQQEKLFIADILSQYEEQVTDEGSLLEIEKKKIDTRLKVEKSLRDYYLYKAIEEGTMTQEEADKALTKSSNDYWKAYANELMGLGDVAGYNDAMSHVKNDDRSKLEIWLEEHGISRKYLKDLERAAKLTIGYIGDIIDAYHELAEAAVEAAEKQVEAANKVYEAELGAYENGYANNVEFARKELALRKQQLAEAQAQERKYAKMQQATESAEQAVTLASTIAYLFRDAAKTTGFLGIPLAIAASSTMLAAFTASKITAAKLAKQTVEYGDGMHEYLNYGGSHASGNDIDFGTTKDGRRRRVERGEMVAVFNKRNTDRYGAETLGNLVDSINHGTFEKDYLGIFNGGEGGNGVIIMNNFPSSVSEDISAIRKSTENQRYVAGNGTIVERHRNRTRIIHMN